MFPHACSLVELILLELLREVESTQEGHHKLSIPAYSLFVVFQNKILPADFKVTFNEENC